MKLFVFVFLGVASLAALAQSPATVTEETAPVKLNVENQPSFGPADAAVTIVEFGDLQCPSCRAEAPILRELIPALYDNRIRIVFKDFPLETIHPWARSASIAGRCVFRQKKEAFWKFYDWDYDNQDEITLDTLKPKVLAWAAGNGVNAADLERCIDSKATDAEVAQNISEGRALGVRGTPTVFVNGRKAVTGQGPGLQQMIDSELAAKAGSNNRK
jgi:protein-disulfide isomerase